MVKIGMVIGERYEILEKIGNGGMSDVYKAKCHKLNRMVAVKILKQEFSENANFVSKFRIEAQAAAGLMHPNIVNVYDVGEENGIYYIVMELVEGITLKRYIEKKARLSYKEAVSIAIQVSMGIEAAHNNHIIHRDIKPQNIIISREGKVKVTDFGIAKAATSNTITSNVMGSVHYTSPEQARGGYSDAKSDIYSLGVTLFEMLTGRVPFNGETTVAIAIKHIQEEMPSPKEFVPEIPDSVDSIIRKCCQKSPDRRYQNMRELINDLKQSLINPDQVFAMPTGSDVDGTTRMMSAQEVAQIKKKARHHDDWMEDTMRLRKDAEYYEEDMMEEDGDEYDYDPKMEKVTTILAIFAGIVICGIILFLLLRVFDIFGSDEDKNPSSLIISSEEVSKEPEEESSESKQGSQQQMEVEMPSVIGWNLEDARRVLEKRSLKVVVEYEESEEYDEGVVIRADKETGDMLEEGASVLLTVSQGAPGIEVPTVVGKTREDASSVIGALGLLAAWEESYHDTAASGIVISQIPEGGTRMEEGGTVRVIVSKGSSADAVKVPNVIGSTEEEAKKAMAAVNLSIVSVSHVNSSTIPEGRVCYQSYSQGSYVNYGTGIEIHISIGPAMHKYNDYILAPTQEEAPDYVAGTPVKVVMTTNAGVEILNTTISGFPQPVNFSGIPSDGATIKFTYTVTTAPGSTTDPVTGETVMTQGTTEEKSFTRKVSFVRE